MASASVKVIKKYALFVRTDGEIVESTDDIICDVLLDVLV